jgi:hypothetical protein
VVSEHVGPRDRVSPLTRHVPGTNSSELTHEIRTRSQQCCRSVDALSARERARLRRAIHKPNSDQARRKQDGRTVTECTRDCPNRAPYHCLRQAARSHDPKRNASDVSRRHRTDVPAANCLRPPDRLRQDVDRRGQSTLGGRYVNGDSVIAGTLERVQTVPVLGECRGFEDVDLD